MSRCLIVSCIIALAAAIAGCNGPVGDSGRRTNGLVPAGAKLAASGKPTIAHFTSGGTTLYVVDESAKSLIFSGEIPADAQVVIRLDRETSALVAHAAESEKGEGEIVLAKPIDKEHQFSMWTLGQPSADSGPTTRSIEISE